MVRSWIAPSGKSRTSRRPAASTTMVSSTLGEFNYPALAVSVNPADAERRGIVDGETVRVFNELGEVICHARVDLCVREGVVSMPKGAWRKSSMNGKTSTALCPAHLNVVGGGACFNDARVEIARSMPESELAREA